MNRSRITGDLVSQNNIFVDIANDRVGIGSTIPAHKLSLPDNARISLGDSADFQIYHMTHVNSSVISKSSSGSLFLDSLNDLDIRKSSTGAVKAKFISDGAVELYYSGSKKFETTAYGIDVTGTTGTDGLVVSGISTFSEGVIIPDNKALSLGNRLVGSTAGDLRLYHDGSNSYIDEIGSGNLFIRNGSDTAIFCQTDGTVRLYNDGNQKLETEAWGIDVTGTTGTDGLAVSGVTTASQGVRVPADGSTTSNYISVGAGNDLKIYHNGTDNVINSVTGKIRLVSGDQIRGRANAYVLNNTADSENMLRAFENGAVELFYNASKKFETVAQGINVTGTAINDGLVVAGIATFNGTGIRIENATTPFIHLKDTTNSTDSFVSTNDEGSLFLKADDNQEGPNTRIVFQIDGSEEASFRSGGNLDLHGGGSIIINDNQKLYFEGDNDDDFNCIGRQTSENSMVLTSRHDLANIIDSNNDDTDSHWSVRHNGTTIAGSSELFKVQSDGKVSVNESSPDAMFHVLHNSNLGSSAGDKQEILRLEGHVTNDGILDFKNVRLEDSGNQWTTTAFRIQRRIDTTDMGYIDFGTGSGQAGRDIEFASGNGTLYMHLDNTGNVGIATNNPTFRLQIGDSTVSSDNGIRLGKRVTCSNTNLPLIGHHSDNGTGSGLALCSTSGSGHIHFFTGNGAGGFGAGSNEERLRITNTGLVGLGTVSPNHKLHIQGSNPTLALESDATTGNTNIVFGDSGSETQGRIQYHNNGDYMRFDTNGDERLRIDSSGRVGIGTDTMDSSADLSITNSGSARIYMKSGNSSDCSIIFGAMDDAATGAIRYDHSDDTLRFYGFNNSERLRIRSNGSMIAQTGSLSTTPLMELYNTDGNAQTGTVLKLRTGRGQSTKDMPVFHITDTSDNSLFEVENSGRVGIFNNDPAYLLDIVNNTSADGIRLRSTGSTYHDFYFDAARASANQHIGRIIAKWNGNNTSMIDMRTGSDTTNKDNGYIAFCAAEAGSTLTERFRCQGSAAGLSMQNGSYIEIPHDERCIVFDEGQKMITSNDGQGNFNMFGGKNNDAVHVSSSSGNSGIAQMEINSDGANGAIHWAVGPTRSAGSSASFEKGFKMEYHSNTSADRLNGLKVVTGNSTSPSGLSGNYPVIHKGNAADGTWARVAGDGFKVLGDGGSIAITTNDGYGNCNVCWNHKDGIPDTTGSAWRIRCDIDSSGSDMNFQTASSASNGTAVSTGSRMVLASNGNLQIDGNLSTSDQRFKTNIQTITGATDKIKALTGKTFKWKDGLEMPSGTKYGFIAQEVESVVPDLVDESRIRGFDKDGNIIQDHYHNKDDIVEWGKGVDDSGITPILVEALKEAIAKIETLEAKVAALEGS